MTILYLAWQDRQNRGWYPIGRMTRHEIEPFEYEFEYVRGAEEAQEFANPFVIPVPGFPDLNKTYHAPVVFPAFRYRAMNQGRPDRDEYLESLGLDADTADLMEELAVSGGLGVVDSFEVFPSIEPDLDGRFKARLIVRGLRRTDPAIFERVNLLNPGDRLELVFASDGPFNEHAVGVRTADQQLLGWLPRFLMDVLRHDEGQHVTDVEVRVAQVNHEAPLTHRVLVELIGRLPPGRHPMKELTMYQPISASRDTS